MEKALYLILLLPAFVSALTIHEFAHAWMAVKLGDDTPRRMGRLTLDPMAHLDPIGSLMILVVVIFNAPLLGWAKPVPFQPGNLKDPRRGAILIAIAGPISNILQAIIWLLALWVFRLGAESMGVIFDGNMVIDILNREPNMASLPSIIATVLTSGVILNVALAVFNMIPIPPLDGHYVLEGLGPPFVTDFFNTIRPFSFIILLLLIQTPILGMAVSPFIGFAYDVVIRAFGLIV